jgi:hypothetical protein
MMDCDDQLPADCYVCWKRFSRKVRKPRWLKAFQQPFADNNVCLKRFSGEWLTLTSAVSVSADCCSRFITVIYLLNQSDPNAVGAGRALTSRMIASIWYYMLARHVRVGVISTTIYVFLHSCGSPKQQSTARPWYCGDS